MTGKVRRFQKIDLGELSVDEKHGLSKEEFWDECIEEADAAFRKKPHNLITNNCHDHVIMALNKMGIDAKVIPFTAKFTLEAQFVDKKSAVLVYLPFLLILIFLLFFLL
ncbi:hypothetical protein MHBO_000632 [Bonamia ostreae]|uniref:Uncharacterized protein n=1 Tax=Bonamia ostreae TaxID=126728 RepID=A0ABV2AG90_9EUKA